jgi:hypothetical protein
MNYRTDDRVEESSLMPSDLKEFMHRININKVRGWDKTSNYWLPSSIDAKCGYCQEWSNLVCEYPSFHPHSLGFTLHGRCVRCNQNSRVFVDGARENKQEFNELWVLPKPENRDAKINTEKIDNARISKAYREAVKAFNDNSPSLSISACGRIVEGIGKTKFPNSKGVKDIMPLLNNLRKELKEAPAFKEILMPLLDLGEALRLGRNPASHFDLETDPNLDLAGKVLDLTEFLLQYVYVISGESINVDGLIKACGPGDDDSENNSETEE